jgi:hypothetical protein
MSMIRSFRKAELAASRALGNLVGAPQEESLVLVPVPFDEDGASSAIRQRFREASQSAAHEWEEQRARLKSWSRAAAPNVRLDQLVPGASIEVGAVPTPTNVENFNVVTWVPPAKQMATRALSNEHGSLRKWFLEISSHTLRLQADNLSFLVCPLAYSLHTHTGAH